MITAGIDIGSVTTKGVLLADGKLLGTRVRFTGYNAGRAGRVLFDELLSESGVQEAAVQCVVATGYGRKSASFAHRAMTEIICHGTGAYFQDAGVRSVIDIGGQDSKVILLDDAGRVKDFAMNDKCAAGTGRFLEVMARALETDLEEFSAMAGKAGAFARISNLCTVFAESEVISLIAKGTPREEIIAGIHQSVATRVAAIARRIGVRAPVMMTGGVAQNRGVVAELEKELSLPIAVAPYSQVNGALGGAVLAMESR